MILTKIYTFHFRTFFKFKFLFKAIETFSKRDYRKEIPRIPLSYQQSWGSWRTKDSIIKEIHVISSDNLVREKELRWEGNLGKKTS